MAAAQRQGRSAALALAAAVVLVAVLAVPGARAQEGMDDDMYCGKVSCYEVLGLERDAPVSAVKRAYRRLSLQHHPDKSRAKDAVERFREVATAYEVLKDEESRAEYDYMLDHPEEVYRNRYRYYRFRYARKTNVWFVLAGAMLVANVVQYTSWYSRYLYIRRQLKQHPEVRRRLELKRQKKAAEEEEARKQQRQQQPSQGGGARQRRGAQQAAAEDPQEGVPEKGGEEDELAGIVEFSGWQGRPPTWRDLLIWWFPRAAWRLAAYVYWLGRWYVKFSLLKHEYGYDERAYITRRVLEEKMRAPPSYWKHMPESKRRELVAQELWVDENLLEFRRDLKNQGRRRRR